MTSPIVPPASPAPVVAAPAAPAAVAAPAVAATPVAAPAAPATPVAPTATPTAPAAPAADYTFALPEGHTLDGKIVGVYGTVAKELGVSQEHAQKILDKLVPVMRESAAEQMRAAVEAKRAEWSAQTQADPEIGGDKLAANIELGRRVLAYGGDQLPAFLKETGLDVHPAVIKWAAKIGAVISPDKLPSTSPSTTPASKTLGETFFPSMSRR